MVRDEEPREQPPGVGLPNGDANDAGRVLRVEVTLRGLVTVIAALGLLFLVARLWVVVVLILASLVLMAALLPFVEWMERHGVGRTAACLLTIAGVLLALVALLVLTIPSLVTEFRNIDENLPSYARELDESLASFGVEFDLEQRARDFDLSEAASGSAEEARQPALAAAISLATVLVLTAYLLVDVPRLSRFVFHFVPRGREAEITTLLASLRQVVGGYVRGQTITSACITLYTFIVLVLVGAPNPLAFSVLAGFADIIPLIGGLLAIVPATVATLGVSVERAALVLGLLVLYQQFEDRYLVPKVYGATLGLPPLVVLLVVLAGGQLLGIMGVLLALPGVAATRVIIAYLRQHDDLVPDLGPTSRLHDEIAAPDAAMSTESREGAHQ